MIIPFPDKRQQQRDLASRFIKDARTSFAGKNKSGYFLVTWSEMGDIAVAFYDGKGIATDELEAYVDIALDLIEED